MLSKKGTNLQPALFQELKNYNKEKFFADLMSGIIVGIVALPLAIAFGISSGVTPEKGIITAIIAGFIISFFGGSRIQIGGPTGAFIVIVYGVVEQYGVIGLAIATVLAGIMLLTMGILQMGTIIKFMPYPIVVGFTSGIALTIFSTQIKDLLGLNIEKVPADFFAKWSIYAQTISTTDVWTATIGIISIILIFVTPKISKKIPGSLVAIILMTLLAYSLKQIGIVDSIQTIGDRFRINNELPTPNAIEFNLESIRTLFPVAFTIAVLGAIESLLSATVADGVIGEKHNSNMELVAQGVANIITPFFGGIPATGAIARTMTNINNGGRTPIAGIIHAVVLLLILLFLGNLTRHIPMACLAGVLIVVAYNMSEWRTFLSLSKQSKSTLTVLLTTFILTAIFDLTIAIEIGIILAIFIFLKRMTESTEITITKGEVDMSKEIESHSEDMKNEILQLPESVEVYEINGPFFFGIANKFDDVMRQISEKPKIRIIRMRKVPFIDSTGIKNLENLCKNSQKENIQIILSGVNPKVEKSIVKSHILNLVGEENICPHIHAAVDRAKQISEG